MADHKADRTPLISIYTIVAITSRGYVYDHDIDTNKVIICGTTGGATGRAGGQSALLRPSKIIIYYEVCAAAATKECRKTGLPRRRRRPAAHDQARSAFSVRAYYTERQFFFFYFKNSFALFFFRIEKIARNFRLFSDRDSRSFFFQIHRFSIGALSQSRFFSSSSCRQFPIVGYFGRSKIGSSIVETNSKTLDISFFFLDTSLRSQPIDRIDSALDKTR